MMKKIILSIFAIFLLVPLVCAVEDIVMNGTYAVCGSSEYIFCDVGDYQSFGGTNLTPAHSDLLSTQGWVVLGGTDSLEYRSNESKLGNMSISTMDNITGLNFGVTFDFGNNSNVTIQLILYDNPADKTVYSAVTIQSNVGSGLGSLGLNTEQGCIENHYYYDGSHQCASTTRATRGINFTFYNAYGGDYTAGYIDRTKIFNDSSSDSVRYIQLYTDDTYPISSNWDELYVWKGTPENRPSAEPPPPPPPDTTPPTIVSTSINNTTPKVTEDVLLTALVSDETAVDWARLSHNQSGTMLNVSLYDISGSTYNATHNLGITASKHTVIGWQWWVNDTSNNVNISDTFTFTVQNTAPSNPTIIYPTADLRTNEQPLNLQVTFSADADNDAITIYYYINDTLNQTSGNNVTYEASDGYYNLKVSITDNEEFSNNVSVNFEIDTIFPIMIITSPTTTTYIANITINVTCTDTNPFILNYTFYNSTYDIIQSSQDNTAVGNLLEIIEVIDTTNLPDGSYTANFSCSDSHTKQQIDDYYITYEGNGIMYDTAEGNRIKIQQIGKPATPSTSKKIDRYEFYFGTSENIEQRTYKIISTWNNIIVVEDSNYDAHLVVWNKENNKGNWIDFESSDSQIISIERINPRHVEVTIWATDFNFKSIGGLNVITESIALTIGTAVVEEEVEEDAIMSAVLLLGGIAIMIVLIIIMITSIHKAMKGEK